MSARYIPLAVSTTPSQCQQPPRGANNRVLQWAQRSSARSTGTPGRRPDPSGIPRRGGSSRGQWCVGTWQPLRPVSGMCGTIPCVRSAAGVVLAAACPLSGGCCPDSPLARSAAARVPAQRRARTCPSCPLSSGSGPGSPCVLSSKSGPCSRAPAQRWMRPGHPLRLLRQPAWWRRVRGAGRAVRPGAPGAPAAGRCRPQGPRGAIGRR